MKNTSLFMMFTLLGAPGFVIAADSDLANAEYNFTVNELSRSSLNQAGRVKIIVHCFSGWSRQQSES